MMARRLGESISKIAGTCGSIFSMQWVVLTKSGPWEGQVSQLLAYVDTSLQTGQCCDCCGHVIIRTELWRNRRRWPGHVDGPGACTQVTWGRDGTRCIAEKRQGDGESLKLQSFMWMLHLYIPPNLTLLQVHSFMETVFPNSSGFFSPG